MDGILLSRPIAYLHASLRAFRAGEFHISRRAEYDVLILMLGGVLRFTEDDEEVELRAGEYYIQRCGGLQTAPYPSDSPRYLYIHFHAEWGRDGDLPQRGRFSQTALGALVTEMDTLAHVEGSYIARCAVFYRILSLLGEPSRDGDVADAVRAAIEEEYRSGILLSSLAERFHFGKNHLIHLFKARYGVTPVVYANRLRIARARYLLEVTSESTEAVSEACGFAHYSHFYRHFLREVGMTPSEYRASVRR
jgi:AraC-like DNA-binding protein